MPQTLGTQLVILKAGFSEVPSTHRFPFTLAGVVGGTAPLKVWPQGSQIGYPKTETGKLSSHFSNALALGS